MERHQASGPTETPGPGARRPIAPSDTSTTAIVASADQGPVHQPTRVTRLADFEATYGPAADSALGRAVTAFLANGGTCALAVRADSVRPALRALGEGDRFQILVIDESLVAVGDLIEANAVCEKRRAFLVADAEPGGQVPPELVAAGARNAAVYYPRILDEGGTAGPVAAAVAGVYARNDRTRGIWKASTGHSASVVGAAGVETALTDRQLGQLSQRQVNALRRMPDGTVVVWGDRTVSPDPEWKYVNVRRHLLALQDAVEDGLQWAASEVDGEPLWAQVREDVADFLQRGWRKGAFPGDSPEEAYSVRCDATTMTEEDIASGSLVVVLGVATVQPGELVTVRVVVSVQPG